MKFSKIKITKSNKVEIDYYTDADEITHESTFISIKAPDEIPASFKNALNALRKVIIDICELDCKPDKIEMRGISISEHPKIGSRGFVFTALKTLDKTAAPLLLNTPLKYDNYEDEKFCLSAEYIKLIIKVEQEAISFLREKESQLSLFTNKTAA